jgi:hypothetical protein
MPLPLKIKFWERTPSHYWRHTAQSQNYSVATYFVCYLTYETAASNNWVLYINYVYTSFRLYQWLRCVCSQSSHNSQNISKSTNCSFKNPFSQCQGESYFTTGALPPISLSCRQAPWDSRPVIYFPTTLAVIDLMQHPLWWEDGAVVYNCCWPSPA